MEDKLRAAVRDVEIATDKLGAKTRDIDRILRRYGPTPVVDGKELPGTIVISGVPGENDGAD